MITLNVLKEASEKYNNLQFKDDFLFCRIMEDNPDIAKELLELILGIKIAKVVPQIQKPIEITAEAKGIRLDVYRDDDEGTIYDLEMQTTKKKNLPKRTRYYQGMIDLDLIQRGADFDELKRTYIIFICTEDPFGDGKHIYSFENTCREIPEKSLGDEAYKIILNASGTQADVSDDLKDFFQYLMSGEGCTALTRKIEREVQKARDHVAWKVEYMTLYMRDLENRRQGYDEGLEEGREKGLEEGREKGLEEGREIGLEEGREKGREEGREIGLEEGLEIGRKTGFTEGRKEARLEIIQSLIKAGIGRNHAAMTALNVTEEEYGDAVKQMTSAE